MAFLPLLVLFLAIGVIFIILMIVSMWKIFEKAGEKGWAAIIPFYNSVKLLEITRKPLWWVLLLFIPFVNIFIWIIVANRVSKVFGHGKWFTAGIILLPFIFLPILAFGSSRYSNKYPQAAAMTEATKWALVPTAIFLTAWYVSMMIDGSHYDYATDGHLQYQDSYEDGVPTLIHLPSGSESQPLSTISDGNDGGNDSTYVTDGRYVYQNDQIISGADPATFQILGDGTYARDAHAVYDGGSVVVGADPKTFVPLLGEYAKDTDTAYYGGTPIFAADTATFRTLDQDYALDDNAVYYDGTMINGADPASFALATDPSGNDNYDAKDANHYYLYGQVVKQ